MWKNIIVIQCNKTKILSLTKNLSRLPRLQQQQKQNCNIISLKNIFTLQQQQLQQQQQQKLQDPITEEHHCGPGVHGTWENPRFPLPSGTPSR